MGFRLASLGGDGNGASLTQGRAPLRFPNPGLIAGTPSGFFYHEDNDSKLSSHSRSLQPTKE